MLAITALRPRTFHPQLIDQLNGGLPAAETSRGMHTMDQDTERFVRATRGNANPLDDVEQKLRHTIFGQARAIEAVVRVLNRARFGFSAGNPRRPRATLLFLGPTGVGKTATARRLAQLLRP